MPRTVTFDFRRGGGGPTEVLFGEVTLTPTVRHEVGASTVLPSPTVVPLVNGVATMPDVAESPSGPLPAWAYAIHAKDGRTGKAWSWVKGVPSGSGAINFKDLPVFNVAPPNTPNLHQAVQLAAEAQESAAISEAAATTSAQAATAAAQLVNAPADVAVRALLEGATQTKAALSAAIATARPKLDLVAKLKGPLYISHRGGPKRYPEHSMEGYRASFQSGFIPEQDLQMLGDGTVVCLHNDTTAATMTGPSRNVSEMTRETFLAKRIKPALPGGKSAVPVTWEQVLDEFGGRTVLVPEIKGTTPGLAEAAIRAVVDRGLERSVIMWSADYATVLKVIAAGIYAGYLTGTGSTADRNIWAADGVYAVAAAMSVSDAHFNNINTAGMKVFTYTPATYESARTQIARGAFAVYVDDPWGISGQFLEAERQTFNDGYVWPGAAGLDKTVDSLTTLNDGRPVARFVNTSDSTTRYVEQGWAGELPARSLSIDLDITRDSGMSTGSAARVYLSTTLHEAASESAHPDWLMFHVRRNGEAVIYRRANGGTAAAIATVPAFLASLGAGAADTVRLRFAIDATGGVTLTRLDTGAVVSVDAATTALGLNPLWMSFGFKGMNPAYGNVVIKKG